MSKEFLARKQATAYLMERGFPVTNSTLQNFARNRAARGPGYSVIGRTAVYRIDELDRWIAAKLAEGRRDE